MDVTSFRARYGRVMPNVTRANGALRFLVVASDSIPVKIYRDRQKGPNAVQVRFKDDDLAAAELEVGDRVVLEISGARVGGHVSRSESPDQVQAWLGTLRTPEWRRRDRIW